MSLWMYVENTGDSDTGAHLNEITASLRVDGFSDVEVRGALTRLLNDGLVYSTVDEYHFALTVPSDISPGNTRYAYGSSLNDAIIRVLREQGGERCVQVSHLYVCGAMFSDPTQPKNNLSLHFLAQAEDGVYFLDIVAELALEGRYHERDFRTALRELMNQGHIYTTVDDDHFQWSEYPPHG